MLGILFAHRELTEREKTVRELRVYLAPAATRSRCGPQSFEEVRTWRRNSW
jgi:hypothetical protein